MKAIVAVDRNWAIGSKGSLLVRIPSDHKFFRQETTGKTIVYGRKTLDTFPMAQPLGNRDNIILTRNEKLQVRNARVAHSVDEVLEMVKDVDTDDVYIIGGEQIYRQFLRYCDTVHVTKIDWAYEADAYFPDLDADADWTIAEESDEQTYFDIPFTFVKYVRKSSLG